VIAQQILGKPKDFADAQRLLQLLSGKVHQVLTAVAVVKAEISKTVLVTTNVEFKTLSTDEIQQYWLTGEPKDKAGGYGIQGIGGQFVKQISGSYSAVVGLPLYETAQLLTEFGLPSAINSATVNKD
jgi:septum formation protein